MIGGVDPKVFLVRFYDDCEQEVLAVKVQAETVEHVGMLFDLMRPNTDIRVGDIVRVEFNPTEWEVLAIEPERVALTRSHTNEAGWPVITHCWIDPGRVRFAREAARPKLQLDPSRTTIRHMSAEQAEEWRKTLPPQPEISTPQSQVRLSWELDDDWWTQGWEK